MQGIKYTVTVTTETLSMQGVSSLLYKAAANISNEYPNGKLVAEDGDTVEWITKIDEVTV
jgi:hypothetical protein